MSHRRQSGCVRADRRCRFYWVVLLAMGLAAGPAARAQLETGEVRLSVVDPSGLPVAGSSGMLLSDASHTERGFLTDDQGRFTFTHLPFGVYRLTLEHSGFQNYSALVEVRSAVPREVTAHLALQTVAAEVNVAATPTLLDSHRTGVVYAVGSRQLAEQQSAMPGRGIFDLVNMQPGWLMEANGVLHPRGSEYQTLFVVDGVPMDENRSPGFAPEFDRGDVQSMSILTGTYPAEYGRKLGGVVPTMHFRGVEEVV